MKFLITALFGLLLMIPVKAQEITGLSGWNIFLDPGHSQKENMGIYGYSEAEKTLRVALNLRQLLMDNTDIDTVYICRENDAQSVSLSQRTDYANSLNAAWYHSIHSDAGGPNSNSTLLLWGLRGNGVEKTPNGGKAMSDIMVKYLTAGYRTTTRGSIGDCNFYGTCGSNSGPYLHVNRTTNMASELSEAGFHTNPRQNQLNMNAEWKRLEALTLYWSILDFHGADRPFVGTTVGIVSDKETGVPVNGAVVKLNGKTYTTDTYESLFKNYSTDPDQLHNGFYYFEGLPSGDLELTVEAPGYESVTTTVSVEDTFFTFKDVQLVSSTPPVVASAVPAEGDSLYPGRDNLVLTFSRPMDRASVEAAVSVTPAVEVTFGWGDADKRLTVTTANMDFSTEYKVTIAGTGKAKYDYFIDGNADGTGGDAYMLNFKTQGLDAVAPEIAQFYPANGTEAVEEKPIINVVFNEEVKAAGLSNKIRMFKTEGGEAVSGTLKYEVVNRQSILTMYVKEPLLPGTNYTVQILAGIADIYGNEIAEQNDYTFTTADFKTTVKGYLDNFDTGVAKWWEPQASGSTGGIVTEETSRSAASKVHGYSTGTGSMKVNYGWDLNTTSWMIREYFTGTTSFSNKDVLQVYVFGDASGNQMRFVVNDGASGHEASKWYTVDWLGWKLVSWDLEKDEVIAWVNGDGVLGSTLSFDSFQFTHQSGASQKGELYLDDFSVSDYLITSAEIENSGVPGTFALDQNYPNPFNPETVIRFGVPQGGQVKLDVYNMLGELVSELYNGYAEAGYHTVKFNASNLPSGVYIYKIQSGNFSESKKLMLMK